ncbi:hypothetical protein DKL51_10335 [Micromonospora globispora]|nr:hypothetical protein DKL51_10335 [Micromonospora globispora]
MAGRKMASHRGQNTFSNQAMQSPGALGVLDLLAPSVPCLVHPELDAGATGFGRFEPQLRSLAF